MASFRMGRWAVGSVMALAAWAAFAPAARAADAENPEYKSWAAYKAGTTVKKHQVVTTGTVKQEMDLTTKLVEVTPEKAIVEDAITMTVNGQSMALPGNKRDVPAKLAAPAGGGAAAAGDAKASAKETEETVEAGGKTYKCKVVESTANGPTGAATSKVWTSPEVPGGIVKLASQTSGANKAEVTITLVSFNAVK